METDAQKPPPMASRTPIKISESEAIERINQRSRHKGQFCRKRPASSPLLESHGAYYLVDSCRHYLDNVDDLEGFAKEIGALAPDEFISTPG